MSYKDRYNKIRSRYIIGCKDLTKDELAKELGVMISSLDNTSTDSKSIVARMKILKDSLGFCLKYSNTPKA